MADKSQDNQSAPKPTKGSEFPATDGAAADGGATTLSSAHADAAYSHQDVLKGLLPFIWPKDRPDLRWRVVAAFIALLLAKIVTVLIPIAYKEATDALSAFGARGATPNARLTQDMALGVTMLILAYGAGRVMMMIFNQIRDVFFTRVGQNAVRQLNTRTFRHLHRLSLRFHLGRRTGGVSRVIERGARAIELIFRMGVLNVIPTIFELFMMSAVLAYYFSPLYILIVAVMAVIYFLFTIKASNWRIAIRREMNESDTDANTKAVDSLLNYETVKYFGNEELEARRFDSAMARYEKAAIKTYFSLGLLNSGQAIIFTIALTLSMWLVARGIMAGTHTVGDFVMINAMLIQLYQPLNFMGTVYREIKQGLVDLELMFSLLGEHPEISDKPNAKLLNIDKAAIKFDHVKFNYDADRPILKDVTFEVPAGKMVAIVGPSGAGNPPSAAFCFAFMRFSPAA